MSLISLQACRVMPFARALMLCGVLALVLTASPMGMAGERSVKRIKGNGETMTFAKLRKVRGLSEGELRARVGATGRLTCPWGTATAFLAGGQDTFVTSAHVFVNLEQTTGKSLRGKANKPKPLGARLGVPSHCTLRFLLDKTRYKVISTDLRLGVQAAPFGPFWPSLDWAVGRLDRPVKGIAPYTIGHAQIEPGARVEVISQGMADFTPRVCVGRVAGFVGVGRGSGFTTNCDVGLGASGGPILVDGVVVGLTRGWIDIEGNGKLREHLGLAIDPGLRATLVLQGRALQMH